MASKTHYRPEQPDLNLSSTPTHTTSLSKSERLLVLRLCLFSVAWPHLIHDDELKKQLYRFGYAFNPPDNLKWPRKWFNGPSLPNGSLVETIPLVRELLNRPDALKRLSPPTPAPITNTQSQSPLLARLPPELRNRIFELVLTREDSIVVPAGRSKWDPAAKEQTRKEMPPPITRACRLARSETLPMFFGLNNFTLNTNRMNTPATPYGVAEEWIYTMRPHLKEMHSLTFVLASWETHDQVDITVRICHDQQKDCWKVEYLDNWQNKSGNHQWNLECDSDLLWRLMSQMMEQRSRADFTPEYLQWLVHDLKRIYYHVKGSPHHPAWVEYSAKHEKWFLELVQGPLPGVARPPDMYTTDLDMEFLGSREEIERSRQWGAPREVDSEDGFN